MFAASEKQRRETIKNQRKHSKTETFHQPTSLTFLPIEVGTKFRKKDGMDNWGRAGTDHHNGLFL